MTRHPCIALATCAELPELDPDDRPLLSALASRGVDASPAVWDDATLDWSRYDLVVLRSTWDYAERRNEFLVWAGTLPAVLNPLPVVRWNTDKAGYLGDLERAGVPIVPTQLVTPGDLFEPPAGEYVVKPAVSAGGRCSSRFREDAGRALVEQLHAEGRSVIVQPYLAAAEAAGETGLVYLEGRFSHAVRRVVPLPSESTTEALYLEEAVSRAVATEQERATGDRALAAVPFPGNLLYARIDLLHDGSGAPLLNELELTEPSLYLSCAEKALEAFADAVARAALGSHA